MTSRTQNLTTLIMLCAGTLAASAQVNFSDNFEAATLDPFWSKGEQSGYVVFPGTTRAHGGSQSAELVSTSSGLDKYVTLYHQFPAPTYGAVSVWVYDTGADVSSANYITLDLSAGATRVASIGTYDYDFGPGDDGSTYTYNNGQSPGYSGVGRTQAWHLFSIYCWSNSLTLLVDGNVIYSGPGGPPLDRVDLALSGPSGRPAWSVQFDDFQFVSQPAPASSDLHMYAGLTVTGTAGAPYQIQYKNSLSSTNWLPLANILLPSSPYWFFDTNSPSAPQRFYRVVANP